MSGHFREACVGVSTSSGGFAGYDLIPKRAFALKAAQDMGAKELSSVRAIDVTSMNETAEQLLGIVRAGLSFSKRQLRDAIWCIWETKPALAESPDALERILGEVAQSDRRKSFRSLATVYLVQFRPDRPGLDRISSTLQQCASRWGEPWARYQEQHALYDPIRGPRNIATLALRENVSPTDAMQSLGLGALDAQSGFTEAITRNLLVDLANGAEPSHQKRLEKIRTYAFDGRGDFLFKGLDLEIAEALMKPFLGHPPDRSIKDIFLNFIVAIFRDPRIHPGRWERFPQIKSLVISWLTEQSLRQFLDIVGRTIDDANDAEMWRYRRAFWEAAHRKGIIKGAWVIFAEDGTRLARRSFGNNAGFGIFNGSGSKQVQRTHAVLLLEIGRGVIADWSHNGKVNVWADASERGAPKLYQARYGSGDVTISQSRYDTDTPRHLVKTHHAPKSYNWQRVVAQRIYQMTNTRLQESDYRV